MHYSGYHKLLLGLPRNLVSTFALVTKILKK